MSSPPVERRKNPIMGKDEVEEIARRVSDEASDKSVRKVFAILGVDFDDPESVKDFQDNLRFNERLRKATDRGFLAFAGVVGVAMAYALWDGIVIHMRRILGIGG